MSAVGLKCKKEGTGKRRTRCSGVTLVEIVLSTFVLAFVITASVVCLVTASRELELARSSAIATQAMQSEAERLRLMNWDSISALPASESVDLSTAITSDSLLFGRLRVDRAVADVAGFANMKEVTLVATWTSSDKRTHTRRMMLRYSKGGLHDYYYGS